MSKVQESPIRQVCADDHLKSLTGVSCALEVLAGVVNLTFPPLNGCDPVCNITAGLEKGAAIKSAQRAAGRLAFGS